MDTSVSTKYVKVIHQVYDRIRVIVNTQMGQINYKNGTIVMTLLMSELNKFKLTGDTKKVIAIQIFTLLLKELGLPEVVASYDAMAIESLLETIYNFNFHRFSGKGCCS